MLQKDLGLDSEVTRARMQERLGRHLAEVKVYWAPGDEGLPDEPEVGSFTYQPKVGGSRVLIIIRKRMSDGMLRVGAFSGECNTRAAAAEVFETMERFPPSTVEEFEAAMRKFRDEFLAQRPEEE